MLKRTWQETIRFGPRKLDGDKVVMMCCECSRWYNPCRKNRRAKWPATTLAKTCPLKAVRESDESEESKESW